jgi:His-Xaa-Ser system protein HxsD
MQIEGLPTNLVDADFERGSVSLEVDESVYPLEVLYATAFTFIDRFYVLLDRSASGRYRAILAPKAGALDEAAAKSAIGDFSAELLACAWRQQITRENRAMIEAVTMKALGGAMGPPSLDDLANFDFGQEEFDDPLGIAVSWEEKYKKKKDDAPAPKAGGEEGTGS